jgi:cell division protein FtsN
MTGEKGKKISPPAELSPGAAAPSKGRYEVQVAAYRERAQADKLVKKVVQQGYHSQVVLKEIPGKGQWYRVIVLGFESREKAREAADHLTEKIGGLQCVIRASAKEPAAAEQARPGPGAP